MIIHIAVQVQQPPVMFTVTLNIFCDHRHSWKWGAELKKKLVKKRKRSKQVIAWKRTIHLINYVVLVECIMPETIWQVLFDFKCPLCRLSEKVREKILFGDFPALFFAQLWHVPRSSVQLCAGERLWSAVSKSPDAVGRQIGVHHRGTSCCRLPPICSCIFFLSFSSASPPTCWCGLFVFGHCKCRTELPLPAKTTALVRSRV